MKPRATHRVLHTRVLHTRHSAVYIGRANKPGRAEGICRLHTVDALTLLDSVGLDCACDSEDCAWGSRGPICTLDCTAVLVGGVESGVESVAILISLIQAREAGANRVN